jgi:hypothetical protein
VLIVLADQLGRSVGDMYSGALIPRPDAGGYLFELSSCWSPFSSLTGCLRCRLKPASIAKKTVPVGTNPCSLLAICGAAGYAWSQVHESIINPMTGAPYLRPGDEIVIMSMTVGSLVALGLALLNKIARIGLLSV